MKWITIFKDGAYIVCNTDLERREYENDVDWVTTVVIKDEPAHKASGMIDAIKTLLLDQSISPESFRQEVGKILKS